MKILWRAILHMLSAAALLMLTARVSIAGPSVQIDTRLAAALITPTKDGSGVHAQLAGPAGSRGGRTTTFITAALNFLPRGACAIVIPTDPLMTASFFTVANWNTPNPYGPWQLELRRGIPLAVHIESTVNYSEGLEWIKDVIAHANLIYARENFGVALSIGTSEPYAWPAAPAGSTTGTASAYVLGRLPAATDGRLHLYVTPDYNGDVGGAAYSSNGIIIGADALQHTLAHEIGHALALTHPLTTAEITAIGPKNFMLSSEPDRRFQREGQTVRAHTSTTAYRTAGWSNPVCSLSVPVHFQVWPDA